MEENQDYKKILSKIDNYIRNHYLSIVIKGILLSLGIILIFFLLISLLENFARFNENVRTVFFFGYLLFSISLLTYFIVIPALKLFKLSKGIDNIKAAQNIGKHFSEIDDKLLNTIQLYGLQNENNKNIIQAILQQRSNEFSKFNFESAVDFKANRKYLKYFISPLLVLILLLFISPSTLTEPTKRLVNYNKEYIPQSPFEFIIENDSLSLIENEDFNLKVKLEGSEIPAELSINKDGKIFRLKKISNTKYEYLFKQLKKNTSFQIIGGKFKSKTYTINVLAKPSILDIEIDINYPDYTKIKDETFKNNGNLSLPEGSKISWKIKTKNTENIDFIIGDSVSSINSSQNERFHFNKVAKESFDYVITSSNSNLKGLDSMHYFINTIKDEFPIIKIEEQRDSLDDRNILFKGFIKDDYGFSNLKFYQKVYSSDNKLISDSSYEFSFKKDVVQQQFFDFIDLSELKAQSGNIINYYFVVWDNDRFNGYKSSKSQLMTYKIPDVDEIIEKRNEQSQDLMSELQKAQSETKKLKEEIKKIQKELQQKKSLEWSDKQRLEELLKKNQQLVEKVEEIKKKNLEKNQDEKKFKEVNEEILEKQKQLEELMEKLLTPELKELMEEMQKLLDEEMKKEDADKLLEKMDINNDDLEKQLDRDLEIMKQLDFEMKLQDVIDKLKNIEEKQSNLSEQSQDKEAESELLKEDQEQLNKEFDNLKEKIEEAEKANKELSKPNNMPDTEERQKSISDEMEKSKEELENNSKKKSSEHQQNAAQQMQKMRENLEGFQSSMSSEQNAENMETLRQILSNLITTSFMQEDLMERLQSTSKNDPKYIELIQEQKSIKNNLEITEDSLLALAKRQASISPFVNREIANINRNADQVIEKLLSLNTIAPTSNNVKNNANANQGQIIESVNKLALMLSDVLEKMQQQSMQQSNGQCNNPKQGQGSKPSLGDIKKMQQALQKKMEQMKNSLGKSGKQKGEGEKSGQSEGEKMSEEMARMAAQQEMIRRMMQEKQAQLKKEGRGDLAKELNKIGELMEENETDLVNKILTDKSLMRQKEILTRLLESEKAERERDKEEERKAEKAEKIERNIPEEFLEYQKLKNKEVELLKTIPLNMKPFYKNKVNKYFESL
jgi:hypothetical protein